MADIYKWSISAALNQANPPDNWKEGMTRAQVNDTGRETHAALRRWYGDAEWVQLHDGQGGPNVVTRETTSSVRIAATPLPPAVADYPVGCRVRITHAASPVVEANVTSASLSGSDLIVAVDSTSIAADANAIRRFISKTTRSAAFAATGILAGQVPLFENFGTAAFKNEGHGNTLDADLLDGKHASYFEGLSASVTTRSNALFNGAMRVAQRGFPINAASSYPNNDNAYCLDRWLLLSEANNNWIIRRSTSVVPVGFHTSLEMESVAGNQKGGIMQVIERGDCKPIIDGGVCSVSFYVRSSTPLNIRAAVLGWIGTANVLAPRDPIATWGAEGTPPTDGLAASWQAHYSSPVSIVATTTWQRVEIPAVDLTAPGNTINLALFIWVEDKSHAAATTVNITGAQLEAAATVSAFIHVPLADDRSRCQRFFCTTYESDIAPGTVTNAGQLQGRETTGGFAAGLVALMWNFPQDMRTTPVVRPYNPATGAIDNAFFGANIAANAPNPSSAGVAILNNANTTAGVNRAHAIADAEL